MDNRPQFLTNSTPSDAYEGTRGKELAGSSRDRELLLASNYCSERKNAREGRHPHKGMHYLLRVRIISMWAEKSFAQRVNHFAKKS